MNSMSELLQELHFKHLEENLAELFEQARLHSLTYFTEWRKLMNDEVLATALLDRLLHHAEVISINGKSYRMKDHPIADKNKAASIG